MIKILGHIKVKYLYPFKHPRYVWKWNEQYHSIPKGPIYSPYIPLLIDKRILKGDINEESN